MTNTGYITFKKNNNGIDINFIKGFKYRQKEGFIVYETIEDSLKSISQEDDIIIAFVKGIGESYKFNNDFYGYENVQIFDEIEFVREVTKEELAKRALSVNLFDLRKILISRRFPDVFLEELETKSVGSKPFIDYYQRNIVDAFKKDKKLMVKSYGKDNNKGCETK